MMGTSSFRIYRIGIIFKDHLAPNFLLTSGEFKAQENNRDFLRAHHDLVADFTHQIILWKAKKI